LWSQGRGGLWGPPDLDLLRRFAERAPADMTKSLQNFLGASRRRRKIATASRYAMISALVLLTIASGYYALQASRNAQAALSRQLAAQSLTDIDALPERSLLLAVESISLARDTGIFHSEDAAQLLHTVLGATGGVPLVGHANAVKVVAFSPDGRTVATGSDDSTARLWDAARPQGAPVVLREHEGAVTGLAFSSDGCWFVTASAPTPTVTPDGAPESQSAVSFRSHSGLGGGHAEAFLPL
jgi:hypothetical protein